MLTQFLKLKSINPRIVLFVCFGIKDNYVESYFEYLKTRFYPVERWKQSTSTHDNILKRTKNNVFIDTNFDVNNINNANTNNGYVQL